MKKLVITIFSLTLMLFIFSCQDNELPKTLGTEESNNEKLDLKKLISVEDNMLVFNDYQSFQSVYEYLSDDMRRFSELDWTNELGFISVDDAYEELASIEEHNENTMKYSEVFVWKEENDELYVYRIVENPFYAALVNTSGYVKVGNNVWKMDSDNIYVINEKKFNENMDLKDVDQKLVIPKKEIESRFGMCSSVYCTSNGKQECKMTGNWSAEVIYNIDIYTGEIQFLYTGYYFYSTSNYRRGFLGRWYSNGAERIGLRANGDEVFSRRSKSSISYKTSDNRRFIHFVIDNGGNGECSS